MPKQPLGRKFDSEKPRWELLSLSLIRPVIRVLTNGSKKYADNNWKHVKGARGRYFSACMRHLDAYQDGEWLDKEDHEPHLAHAICCLFFLLWFGMRKHENT